MTGPDAADDPSAYYRVDESERLDTDEGEGSTATDPPDDSDDTDLLEQARTAPDQEYGSIGGTR